MGTRVKKSCYLNEDFWIWLEYLWVGGPMFLSVGIGLWKGDDSEELFDPLSQQVN